MELLRLSLFGAYFFLHLIEEPHVARHSAHRGIQQHIIAVCNCCLTFWTLYCRFMSKISNYLAKNSKKTGTHYIFLFSSFPTTLYLAKYSKETGAHNAIYGYPQKEAVGSLCLVDIQLPKNKIARSLISDRPEHYWLKSSF